MLKYKSTDNAASSNSGSINANGPKPEMLKRNAPITNGLGSQVTVGGDIVIAFDGTKIRNTDDLSTFLEEYTLPNQTINVTIIRVGQTMTLPLKLGTRPSST